MKPGALFARGSGRKYWKHVSDADGIVHDGKVLHRVIQGHKAEPSGMYSARCDKTMLLYVLTEEPITCVGCLGLRVA